MLTVTRVQTIEVERTGTIMPHRLISFLSVGVLGLTADLAILWLAERVGLPLWAARAVSLPLATLVTWTLNRRHTFGESSRRPHHEALCYFSVAAVAQTVNYLGALSLQHALPHLPHSVDAFLGSVVATLFSYSGQRFFTFGSAERG